MLHFRALLASALACWAAAQNPSGLSQACSEASLTLQNKIVVAQEDFLEANVNCMNACEKMDGEPCTRECNAGISAYESACHGSGGNVLVVAQRVFYRKPQRPYPVARTNFFTCLPPQCNNPDDTLKWEATLQNYYCAAVPGSAPREDCFVDLTLWPQVSPKCEVAYDAMQQSTLMNDAEVVYEQANAACMENCDPRQGHSCTSQCLAGVDVYDGVCRQLPGQPITYALDVTLPDGNGKTSRQMRTCVPADCMAADLPAMAQRLEATTCDDLSATEEVSCAVILLVSDGGAVAGAVLGTLAALVALGFGGFHVATRAGWLSRDRLPGALVRVCECSCCLDLPLGGRAAGGEAKGIMGGSAPSTATGGYAAVA